jgi:hypothetical protein
MFSKWPAALQSLSLGLCFVLPGLAQSEQFSIVVIPDTQFYTESQPVIFEAQMDWIVANQAAENIIHVAHLGDLKDSFACDNTEVFPGIFEWDIVDSTLQPLDAFGIPYSVVPGNHDFDQVGGNCPDWIADRPLTLYNSVVGPSRYSGQPYYGDPSIPTPGNRVVDDLATPAIDESSNEDNFVLFGYCGVKFIAINLAWKPVANAPGMDAEITWADSLLSAYPDRLGIVTTHYILDQNPEVGSGSSLFNRYGLYGAEIYNGLSDNPNLFMLLSGHKRGEAWRVEDRSAAGMQPVQVLLSDYQAVNYPAAPVDFANLDGNPSNFGDSGFMRIMRFDTDTGQVDIETFSPAIPSFGRPADLVSNYFPADGTGMDKDTASNLSFSFQGYVSGDECNVSAVDTDRDSIEDQFDNCPFVANGPVESFCAVDPAQCNTEYQLALLDRKKQSYIDCLISQGIPAGEASMGMEAGPCTFDLFRQLLAEGYDDECAGSPCNGIQEDSNGNGIGDACE